MNQCVHECICLLRCWCVSLDICLVVLHVPLPQHDAAVFRDLNDRLVAAVKGDRVFEAALSFPRAADEDRADRIVDFEHLQVGVAPNSQKVDCRVSVRF